MSQHAHPYHLVSPSPWPVVGALGALTLAVGGLMYMHEIAYGSAVLAVGTLLVAFTMFVWWRDVVREAEHEGHHTPTVQLGLRCSPFTPMSRTSLSAPETDLPWSSASATAKCSSPPM